VWKKEISLSPATARTHTVCTQVTIYDMLFYDAVGNSDSKTSDGKKGGLERVWRERLVT